MVKLEDSRSDCAVCSRLPVSLCYKVAHMSTRKAVRVVTVPKAKCIMCFHCYPTQCAVCVCLRVCLRARVCCTCPGSEVSAEVKKESMAEISLLCEENLLDTIFYACDTQRRGRLVAPGQRPVVFWLFSFFPGLSWNVSFCNVSLSQISSMALFLL